MKRIVTTVGPLAAASATNIATAQRPYGIGALALNGSTSNTSSTSICASQSPGASAFTLNGTNVSSSAAYLPNAYIYIVCAGDSHTITATVVGLDINSAAQTEVITLTNAQASASTKRYTKIISITPSGAVTGAVTVGSYTTATLDLARQVLITTAGNETTATNTALIQGTDRYGNAQSETVTLPNASTVASVLDYLTVTRVTVTQIAVGNISVGTNGVAGGPWVRFDDFAMSQIAIQCTVTGTVNFTVQQTLDDPNSLSDPTALASMTWVDTNDTGAVGATASFQTNYAYCPTFGRILLNSGTGSVVTTYNQALSAVL